LVREVKKTACSSQKPFAAEVDANACSKEAAKLASVAITSVNLEQLPTQDVNAQTSCRIAGVNVDEPRIHQFGILFSFFHDFRSFSLRAEAGRIQRTNRAQLPGRNLRRRAPPPQDSKLRFPPEVISTYARNRKCAGAAVDATDAT
jgi:hypothetical protein